MGLQVSTVLLAAGSGAYHWFLTPATLALDRAAIAAIMAFVAAEAVALATGRGARLAVTSTFLAVAEGSVVLWVAGGTSWVYGGLQAVGGLAVLALVANAFRAGRAPASTVRALVVFLVLYALAKAVEGLDAEICRATGSVGGHPGKHLLAALGLAALFGWMAPGASRAPAA